MPTSAISRQAKRQRQPLIEFGARVQSRRAVERAVAVRHAVERPRIHFDRWAGGADFGGLARFQCLIAGRKRSDAIVDRFLARFVGAAVAQGKLQAIQGRVGRHDGLGRQRDARLVASLRRPGGRLSGGVISARKILFQRPVTPVVTSVTYKNRVGETLFKHARLDVGREPIADQQVLDRDSARGWPRASAITKHAAAISKAPPSE